jgi:hypothetical protein
MSLLKTPVFIGLKHLQQGLALYIKDKNEIGKRKLAYFSNNKAIFLLV